MLARTLMYEVAIVILTRVKRAPCFAPDGACRVMPGCVLRSVLAEAMEAFFGVLDRYHLADVLASGPLLRDLLGIKPAPA